jgi:hypothetical protein
VTGRGYQGRYIPARVRMWCLILLGRRFQKGHFDTMIMLACLNHVLRSTRSPDAVYRCGEAAMQSAFLLHGSINARHGAPVCSWHFRHTGHQGYGEGQLPSRLLT